MRIKVEKEIIMTQLDDEAALLNVKTGKYFSLNTTCLRIFELLQQYEDTEKVYTAMSEEYEIDKNILKQDMDKLICDLADAKLISLT